MKIGNKQKAQDVFSKVASLALAPEEDILFAQTKIKELEAKRF